MSTPPHPKQVLTDWLNTTPYSPKTRAGYHHEVGLWLAWIGPRVWTATPRDIDTWAGPAGRTRAHRISAVRSFYEHTRRAYGQPHPNPAVSTLRGSVTHLPGRRALNRGQSAALMQAADAWRGTHAARDRALVYLLLGMDLRPGPVSDMLVEHLHPDDQNGPSCEVPQKGGGTVLTPMPQLVWLAVRDYLPHRVTRAPYSHPDRGPLLTSRTGRGLDPYESPLKIVRAIAASHELLAHLAPQITADGLAHSETPW